MINKLYVFANMGHLDQKPKSGGQSSSRRVMKGLEDEGFEIVPIMRHRGILEGKIKHVAETGLFAIIDSCKVFKNLVFGSRKNSAFIHLTYSASLVPYELWLTLIARVLGYDRLLYLKGGKIEGFLKRAKGLNLWMFKKNLQLQKAIFFEGASDIELVKDMTKSKLIYFPNYIFDKDIPSEPIVRSKEEIGICYFGKVAPDKNVHVTIEAFEMLAEKYPNLHLTVVGGLGSSKAYYDGIDEQIKNSKYADRITRVGLSSFDYLLEMMRKNHFFLFPSAGRCEGHSNSLNEAMSQGLIPIVSDWHFNRTIVGDDRFVVEGFEPKDYAEKIDNLLTNGDLQEISDNILNRLKERFASSKVTRRIAEELRAL